MAKRKYLSPVLLSGLNPESDPTIVIGGSQGSSGYVSPYTFDGIDDDTREMIDANCDDFDLQAMDTDGDYVITLAEFTAWYDENQPW